MDPPITLPQPRPPGSDDQDRRTQASLPAVGPQMGAGLQDSGKTLHISEPVSSLWLLGKRLQAIPHE